MRPPYIPSKQRWEQLQQLQQREQLQQLQQRKQLQQREQQREQLQHREQREQLQQREQQRERGKIWKLVDVSDVSLFVFLAHTLKRLVHSVSSRMIQIQIQMQIFLLPCGMVPRPGDACV